MNFRTLFTILLILTANTYLKAQENIEEDKEVLFYTGQFDIKDEKGDDETSLFGLEHKNPNLFRDTLLGKFSPVTGAFVTGKGAADVLEFKSEIKLGLDIFNNSKIGYSYSHISNNDWGTTNPGSDNQSITFSKKF